MVCSIRSASDRRRSTTMSSPAPQQVDSPSNHGPIVGVMTWFLLAATVCAVIARVATKLAISRRFTSDDLLIFAALVRAQHSVYFPQLLRLFQGLSIGQGVVVTLQIGKGLGKHADTLTAPQLDSFDQVSPPTRIKLRSWVSCIIVRLCLEFAVHRQSLLGQSVGPPNAPNYHAN